MPKSIHCGKRFFLGNPVVISPPGIGRWSMPSRRLVLLPCRSSPQPSIGGTFRKSCQAADWVACQIVPPVPERQRFPLPAVDGSPCARSPPQRTEFAGQYRSKTSPSDPFPDGCPARAYPARQYPPPSPWSGCATAPKSHDNCAPDDQCS